MRLLRLTRNWARVIGSTSIETNMNLTVTPAVPQRVAARAARR